MTDTAEKDNADKSSKVMNNNKMREISFITNIVGTLIGAILLIFINNLNGSIAENQKTIQAMNVAFTKQLTTITVWMENQNEKYIRLRDRVDRMEGRSNQRDNTNDPYNKR